MIFIISSIVAAGLLIIPTWNLLVARKLQAPKSTPSASQSPKISIIIPMRNEEKNVIETIPKLLNQDYQNYELILINDNSDDQTYEICDNLRKKYPNQKVKIINGKLLKHGWVGKQWAMFQGQKHATGELLLFLDADVHLKSNALSALVQEFQNAKTDMLSTWPTQEMQTLGEKLTVPIVSWGLTNVYSFALLQSTKFKNYAMANGQCILIKNRVYQKVGTHEKVKDSILDDVSLAKEVKANGFKLSLTQGNSFVQTRMYHNLSEAFEGFSRSFYKGAKINPILFLPALLAIYLLYLISFIGPLFNIKILPLTIAVVISRIISSIITRENILTNTILFPLQITFFTILGTISFYKSVFTVVVWKGRGYALREKTILKWDLTELRKQFQISRNRFQEFSSKEAQKYLLTRMKEARSKGSEMLKNSKEKVEIKLEKSKKQVKENLEKTKKKVKSKFQD